MRTICGCPWCRRFLAGALAALVAVGLWLAGIPSAPAEGGKEVGAAKANVYGCKCQGQRFCVAEGATVHCPCGMHNGKWCNCGHPHEGQVSGTLATAADGPWKAGEKRAFTASLQSAAVEKAAEGDGGGEHPDHPKGGDHPDHPKKGDHPEHPKKGGDGAKVKFAAGQPLVGATVGAHLFKRGELWICPMKCEESESSDTCSLCHMKMKKGEGWVVAAPPVAAEGKEGTGEYVFELEASFSGKARIRVSAEGSDGTPAVLDFATEIKE